MKKIPSLFKRNYEGDRLVYDEVVPGSEWVLAGEGRATFKVDGTACTLIDGIFYKRYDRRPSKKLRKEAKMDSGWVWMIRHFKPPPDNWVAVEELPNIHTGHLPGWIPVGDGPEDQWHREAIDYIDCMNLMPLTNTFELIGPKVQSNPYNHYMHRFYNHGQDIYDPPELTFEAIRDWLESHSEEGIVWWHDDGRRVKIKRKDFGLDWPI